MSGIKKKSFVDVGCDHLNCRLHTIRSVGPALLPFDGYKHPPRGRHKIGLLAGWCGGENGVTRWYALAFARVHDSDGANGWSILVLHPFSVRKIPAEIEAIVVVTARATVDTAEFMAAAGVAAASKG